MTSEDTIYWVPPFVLTRPFMQRGVAGEPADVYSHVSKEGYRWAILVKDEIQLLSWIRDQHAWKTAFGAYYRVLKALALSKATATRSED